MKDCHFLFVSLISLCRYTSKMFLTAIEENHKGTYDFLYLPIDFKVITYTDTSYMTMDTFFQNYFFIHKVFFTEFVLCRTSATLVMHL